MKKSILIIIFFLSFLIIGCGTDSDSGTSDSIVTQNNKIDEQIISQPIVWYPAIIKYMYSDNILLDTNIINTIETKFNEVTEKENIIFNEVTEDEEFVLLIDFTDNIIVTTSIGKVSSPYLYLTKYTKTQQELEREIYRGIFRVLGMHFEQQRYTKISTWDNAQLRKIKINTDNINPDILNYYDAYTQEQYIYNTIVYDYDFSSIMHFDSYEFSINGQPTIQRIEKIVDYGDNDNPIEPSISSSGLIYYPYILEYYNIESVYTPSQLDWDKLHAMYPTN